MATSIFAHRGASKYAPENTLPAFDLAYKMKANGIETDVQLTKDNIPIIIHDEKLNRTTNGIGFVNELTLSEIKKLDAGSWFSKKYSNTRLLTLEELLEWIKHKPLYLNIELKNNKIDYKNLEQMVFDMLENYHLLERTILSTFNPNSVARMKEMNHLTGIAFLTSKRNKNLVDDAKKLGANALHIKYKLLNQAFVQKCHQENMNVRVYTINKVPSMKRCFDYDCDGIFTDVPDIAVKYNGSYY
ncbi:glycerophosphodiester phosphodiesterase family protein [Oceanobacillus halophilus]|uniref:Glycerophosphodiester phosphodiesterase n=1 Tax=Oceanobacillus halophilus TaxID=930130 RepID=A0A495AE91_9BACI|nr:glycerophosphodiester phosphodiesterase family protein [Oceanobacillus halophilus]RKQ38013.1 glycerophosphodiester phosphodiesterase [Oceanobacillus halophilus]